VPATQSSATRPGAGSLASSCQDEVCDSQRRDGLDPISWNPGSCPCSIRACLRGSRGGRTSWWWGGGIPRVATAVACENLGLQELRLAHGQCQRRREAPSEQDFGRSWRRM